MLVSQIYKIKQYKKSRNFRDFIFSINTYCIISFFTTLSFVSEVIFIK
jgi:hypothetical protein